MFLFPLTYEIEDGNGIRAQNMSFIPDQDTCIVHDSTVKYPGPGSHA